MAHVDRIVQSINLYIIDYSTMVDHSWQSNADYVDLSVAIIGMYT